MKQTKIEHTHAPVITLVDTLVHTAIERGASDIHLEPTKEALRIRFRIDGVLFDQDSVDARLMAQAISRIKVMSSINIAEKRIPQDGKFTLNYNKHDIDLRVSTFPALHGEKIVVRILDRSTNQITLDKLGMSQAIREQFTECINRSSGFFLVAGPTGSGKTTTLYAALSAINAPEKNIITLEDPIEYNINGVTQGQVNPDAGFTFTTGIRAVLRQDPDIAMIGEIRDKQTAQTAIEAGLTGHLVLSTVHTNDAPSVIMRLIDMGIEPFLINAAITGVLAQRLARTICSECKVSYKPDEQEQATLKRLNIVSDSLHKGTGCSKCLFLGYKGRTGIFELLSMTSPLRALVVQKPAFDQLYDQACNDGMQSLLVDGGQKVQQGVITLQELLRSIS